ncbi:MAG: hypothetical protein ACFB21_02220 [Opitutales bacterium]
MQWWKRLFGGARSRDGMAQTEREAFVDLLVYAQYADRSLSLSEDKAFNAEISALAWDNQAATSALPLEDYVNRAIARVRGIRRHTVEEDDFLAERTDVLRNPKTRQRLLTALENVTWADGDEAGDERTLKQHIRDLVGG